MSDDSKESRVEQLEGKGHVLSAGPGVGSVAPLTKKQKAVRHCKRWWWVHLLILIAIVVLVVCLIIFVAIPKIAQSRVNSAKLTIQGISLSQTQATNFTIAINSTIEADDSIHAIIDPFEGVMYLEDWPPQTPFARIQFPSVTSAPMTAVNISQFTQILDMNAFTIFNEYFIVNETIRVTVEGDSHLQISGLNKKYPVHFKKTIEMPSLSNLNGTTVPTSTVLLQPDANGNNFIGTAVIPNRSYITFELGNTSFINYMQDANGAFENVGTIFIDNLTIAPGSHSYPLRGTVAQAPVLTQIQLRPYCETGEIPFLLQGLSVVNDGQLLSYFTDSLASTNQSVSIPLKDDLQALGLTINCLAT
ncbi:unnamed protein product [Discula destructiva]